MLKQFDGTKPTRECDFSSLEDFRYFSSYMRYLISASGYQDKEFAKLANLSHISISRYTNNKHIPDIASLVKISRFLHISINALLGIEDYSDVSTDDEISSLFNRASEDDKIIIQSILKKYKK